MNAGAWCLASLVPAATVVKLVDSGPCRSQATNASADRPPDRPHPDVRGARSSGTFNRQLVSHRRRRSVLVFLCHQPPNALQLAAPSQVHQFTRQGCTSAHPVILPTCTVVYDGGRCPPGYVQERHGPLLVAYDWQQWCRPSCLSCRQL